MLAAAPAAMIANVRFVPKADVCSARRHVRFAPESGRNSDIVCGEGIVHINVTIPHSALYLSVTKQKLDGAQIPGAPIDECRLEEHASCKAMSAFTVAIRCKADMRFCTANGRF